MGDVGGQAGEWGQQTPPSEESPFASDESSFGDGGYSEGGFGDGGMTEGGGGGLFAAIWAFIISIFS